MLPQERFPYMQFQSRIPLFSFLTLCGFPGGVRVALYSNRRDRLQKLFVECSDPLICLSLFQQLTEAKSRGFLECLLHGLRGRQIAQARPLRCTLLAMAWAGELHGEASLDESIHRPSTEPFDEGL